MEFITLKDTKIEKIKKAFYLICQIELCLFMISPIWYGAILTKESNIFVTLLPFILLVSSLLVCYTEPRVLLYLYKKPKFNLIQENRKIEIIYDCLAKDGPITRLEEEKRILAKYENKLIIVKEQINQSSVGCLRINIKHSLERIAEIKEEMKPSIETIIQFEAPSKVYTINSEGLKFERDLKNSKFRVLAV